MQEERHINYQKMSEFVLIIRPAKKHKYAEWHISYQMKLYEVDFINLYKEQMR